jgi:hypothetical protein
MSERLRFNTARELFEAFPAAVEDMVATPTDRPALEFLAGLVAGPTPEDAITFCAYLLPRRGAVWWGIQCLNHRPELLTVEDRSMLATAERWVRRPDEDQRNAALDIGMASPTKTPGAWIALAAGWSGGSMLGADEVAIAPPPYLTAKAVNAGVLSALARVERKVRAATLRLFVDMGAQLAGRS